MSITLPNRKSATAPMTSNSQESVVRTRVQADPQGLMYAVLTVEQDGELLAAYRNDTGWNPAECPWVPQASNMDADALFAAVLTSLMTPIYRASLNHETPEQAIIAALDEADSFEWTAYASEVRTIRPTLWYNKRTQAVVIDGKDPSSINMPREYLADIGEWLAQNKSEFVMDDGLKDRIGGRSKTMTTSEAAALLNGAAKPTF